MAAAPILGPERELSATFPNAETIDRIWHFAEKMAGEFIPDVIRGDVASVFYLIATGEDLGLRWTHAVRGMYLTQAGKLGMEGQVLLALLQSRGFGVTFTPSTDPVVACTCTITRPGSTEGASRTFTLDDAKRIKIYFDRETKAWRTLADTLRYHNHGPSMCQWRALAACGRVQAADLMGGIYLPDELDEVESQREHLSQSVLNGQAGEAEQETEDPFAVGEKEGAAAVETIELNRETIGPNRETIEPQLATEAPVEETAPAPPPQSNVVEIPKAAAPVIKYGLFVAIPREGKKPELVACGVDAMDDKEAAIERARAVAVDKKLACVVLQVVDGTPKLDPVVAICNTPTTTGISPGPALGESTRERRERNEYFRSVSVDEDKIPPGVPAPPGFDDLIGIVKAKLGGDARATSAALSAYFKAYFSVPTVPKDKNKLMTALRKLVDVLDARAGDLRANAAALGAELSKSAKSKLDVEFEIMGWSPYLQDLARKVIARAGQSEDQFLTWLQVSIAGSGQNGIAIAQMDPAALSILFPLYLLVKGRAFEPVDMAIARGLGVTATLQTLVEQAGKPIAGWDIEFATRILDALKQALAPQDPPQSAAVDDWDTGGLPFGS